MDRSWESVLQEHLAVAAELRAAGPTLDAIADAVIAAFRTGHRLYICGNGGSAADAQHIAAELSGRFRQNRRALPAIALTTDTSALTAIGNDFGFDAVFARQVEALARSGDLLWALSTSGNSPNVIRAIDAARKLGARVIGFTGKSGGQLANCSDWLVRVPHESADRIQEGHELAYHYLCERIEAAFVV